MEDLPEITDRVRLPLEIKVHPYMMDHRFQGKAVLPAVEAMQLLAVSTRTRLPDVRMDAVMDAGFAKFLYLEPGVGPVKAFNEIEINEDGTITSKLITKSRSKKASITRTIEHVSIHLSKHLQKTHLPPLDKVFALEGICLDITAERLYSGLVPFGPAYCNVKGSVTLSGEGAVAYVCAPEKGAADEPLGSPFPLDAAFHVACAWGQRYAGIVGFPVGLEKRYIFNRTSPGESYVGRVIPRKVEPGLLVFDIWIFDQDGTFYEAALGVQMKDVSSGRIRPPSWIMDGARHDRLQPLRNRCEAISVIELKTLKRAAEKALSGPELERFDKMGDKRKKDYLGARLCCKALSRRLSGRDMDTPASSITTISADPALPCCPLTDGRIKFSCSVSHDSRFAIAVASGSRVGVDVEEISERVLKSRRFFMSEAEKMLVRDSSLGEVEASLMVWSIKEAVSKAFGISLVHAWEKVAVKDIGMNTSSILMEGLNYTAFHVKVDGHVFTMVKN
ncbi:MAG: polyketide synthase dehydratase domain-containing protein [Deltaproteobacteria bacterium]|nr:polyketide synthase dehydratase domain-containing protein [Deltaproteobacteria bacterium]MBW2344915.1 polyketide synthase dehydratase domain-containing protein [Deltaproteobacteria bacterium]